MTAPVSSYAGAFPSSVDPADPETAAIILALRDVREARKQAQARRDAAYGDRIELLSKTAAKLRSMAHNALASGFVQAGLGVASAALSLRQAFKLAAAEQPGLDALAAGASRKRAGWAAFGADSLAAAGSLDPFKLSNDHLQADRQRLELRAEKAARRFDRAQESKAEAERLESSLKAQLSKLGDASNAATGAASRL